MYNSITGTIVLLQEREQLDQLDQLQGPTQHPQHPLTTPARSFGSR